jgi:hypothetical protein
MKRIDEYTIEVPVVVSATEKRVMFDRAYLERQRKSIQTSRDEFCALRDAELKEVDGYLAKCDELGIIAREINEDRMAVQAMNEVV